MELWSYFLIGVSLSMDALAIAISTGIFAPHMKKKDALKVALYFGGFQALMPVLGWLLGKSVAVYIQQFDHWVAFGLLAFIGIKMIVDAVRQQGSTECKNMLSHKVLFTMAIATSIDALAVGLTLALVNASIVTGATIIGITTFALSFVGALFGCRLGAKFEKKAMVIGGIVLVGIGTKILIEHLLGS